MSMASTKTAARKTSSRASSKRASSSNGGARRTQSKSRSNSRATTKRASSSNGAARRTQSKSRSGSRAATKGRTTRSSNQRARPASGVGKAVDTAKQVAGKAKAPALAIGAGAAGLAGGLALKSRMQRKTVLGVPLPRSLRPGVDVKSIAKTMGEASQRVAKTSKTVSKDIERAGDKAERIGKILS